MPASRLKLRDAHEDYCYVNVTETDGTVHEGVVVWDYTRVVTEWFEIWRFQLRGPDGFAKVWAGQLESVEVLD
jgi:hypothetical protein